MDEDTRVRDFEDRWAKILEGTFEDMSREAFLGADEANELLEKTEWERSGGAALNAAGLPGVDPMVAGTAADRAVVSEFAHLSGLAHEAGQWADRGLSNVHGLTLTLDAYERMTDRAAAFAANDTIIARA